MKSYGRLAAEFVLIVVGVLFALMVDAAIQRSNDDTLRQQYISRLIVDLEADYRNFQNRIGFFSIVRDYSEESLNWLRSDLPFDNDVLLAGFLAAEIWPIDVVSNTYEDLQNTGNINLLEDIEIRTQLAAYHTDARNRRDSGWNLDSPFRPLIRGVIYPEIQKEIRAACPTTDDTDSIALDFADCSLPVGLVSELDEEFEKLRADKSAQYLLTYTISELEVALRLYRQGSEFAERILQLLRS